MNRSSIDPMSLEKRPMMSSLALKPLRDNRDESAEKPAAPTRGWRLILLAPS
jgi:hypothetical protein